jgi:hypothetical protein
MQKAQALPGIAAGRNAKQSMESAAEQRLRKRQKRPVTRRNRFNHGLRKSKHL